MLPRRTPTQFGQPQFYCGKPPPAAEPKTRINTMVLLAAARRHTRNDASVKQMRRCNGQRCSQTVVVFSLIGTNLCAHVDLFEARRFPVHQSCLSGGKPNGSPEFRNSSRTHLGQDG